MPEKIKKFSLVVFLTLLVWAWAYLADEEVRTVSGTLDVFPRTSLNLLVTFNRDRPVPLNLRLKGPATKIADLKRKLLAEDTDQDKERLDFYYAPEVQDEGDLISVVLLDVPQLIGSSTKLKTLGLTVESCDPKTIEVTVEKLVEEHLIVQCLDENGSVLEHKNIEPARVRMFVRRNRPANLLIAYVSLTSEQIEPARKTSIMATPYIELGGKLKYAAVRVKIELPSAEEALKDQILQPTIGYQISGKLLGEYDIELSNADAIGETTHFRATDEAWTEYADRTAYHVLVEVRDGDENIEGEITREVIYNFPYRYVRKNEIKLAEEEPRTAKFKLIPTAARQSSP